jgi:class 3 adenylate cyclase
MATPPDSPSTFEEMELKDTEDYLRDDVEVDSNNTSLNDPPSTGKPNSSIHGENSSLGHDTSSLVSSQSSKFDMDDTTELDELLQNGHLRGGLFGLIERLPLFVKLFMMLVIALLGIVAIGTTLVAQQAKSVKEQRLNVNIARFSVAVAQIVNQAQKERGAAYRYLITNGTGSYLQEYQVQIVATDIELIKFQKQVKKYYSLATSSETTTQYYNRFVNISSAIHQVRDVTLKLQYSGVDMFNAYSPLGQSLTNLLIGLAGMTQDAEYLTLLTTAMMAKDEFGRLRAVVIGGMTTSMSVMSRYRTLSQANYAKDQYVTSIMASGITEVSERYKARSTTATNISDLVNQIEPSTNVSSLVSLTEWMSLTDVEVSALQDCILYTADLINDNANKKIAKGTASIVVILVVVTLLVITSLITAAIFSKAVTGPWKRIIEIQDATIRKFVPRGLLRILKCYRLSDINLGKSVERDLTIMFADIRNFTAMSENMTPAQNFTFLNNYLARVGPVIRKHAGYIDKFMGDGIMACFPNFYNGVKASMEIQEVITLMNKENTQQEILRVGIGIHTGRTIVGAIGENERMEGTMISDAVNLSSRLETLTKAFRAKILTTHEGMKRLRAPSEFAYRPLGYVKVKGKKQHVKVYELIDKSETDKVESMQEFKKAVEYMNAKSFNKALELIDQIVLKYPSDFGAKRVHESCSMHRDAFNEEIKNLQVHQALMNPVLRESFASFCKEERSEENFKFWLATEEYRTVEDEVNRIILTKKIYQSFLAATAKHQVNTSDDSKKLIKDAIQRYDETLLYPPATLFSNLMTEVEILMLDTFGRFKKKKVFMDAFKKSLPVPLVHIMDEDVL